MADSLNHLVFTMPFLPSEGEETKVLINQQMKDVLVFHYLPILWYRYPIPNDLREFWYKERPDILNYFQKAYKNVDIQFLPDSLLNEFNQQKVVSELSSANHSWMTSYNLLPHSSSSELLSLDNLIQFDSFFFHGQNF